MANHVRQQIREKIGTTLTGLTTTGSNVYQSRVYPLENINLPALVIYTKSETSEPIVIGTNRVMSRELSVIVEGYVKATSNFDDTIDTISKEVEAAIKDIRNELKIAEKNGNTKINLIEKVSLFNDISSIINEEIKKK